MKYRVSLAIQGMIIALFCWQNEVQTKTDNSVRPVVWPLISYKAVGKDLL